MDRAEFTGAVERASIVAKDAQYNVINFIVADDQIKLMSQHPDYGTVEDYVPCHLEGQGLDISFNGKFILDILKHCHDSEAPTLENTYNGTYSVWGYEHIYTSKEPKAAVKAFIEYITGADYGKRIEELGYGVSSKMQTKEVH